MASLRVVGLGGGIGASRLWRALVPTLGEQVALTVVVNTADDIWLHGLRICPDIDTTVYALGGVQDVERGWGLREESFRCMAALRDRGYDVWLNLGDIDLGTHLFRTGLLREGVGLGEITRRLAASFDVPCTVLPMTEQEVCTQVSTTEGNLHYQEYLVRDGATAVVDGVHLVGAELARPAPGVLDAIRSAQLIVLAPSSPIASVAPILSLPGVRSAIQHSAAPVVAVTPIVTRRPCVAEGEQRRAVARSTLLTAATGRPATATEVVRLYSDLEPLFILDAADEIERPMIEQLGIEVCVHDTLLHLGAPQAPLVQEILRASRLPIS